MDSLNFGHGSRCLGLNLGNGSGCLGLVFFYTICAFVHEMVRECVRDFDLVGDFIECIE